MNRRHLLCATKEYPWGEEHTCPPCEHGLEKGFTMVTAGDALVDARQRRLKLQTLDSMSCDGLQHSTVLAMTTVSS